jgi:hypothetical protein
VFLEMPLEMPKDNHMIGIVFGIFQLQLYDRFSKTTHIIVPQIFFTRIIELTRTMNINNLM